MFEVGREEEGAKESSASKGDPGVDEIRVLNSFGACKGDSSCDSRVEEGKSVDECLHSCGGSSVG